MTAHLLLTAAEHKNPLEHARIITCLTTIIPSANVDKKQSIDKKYENLKAAKHVVCVFARACVTYIFLSKISGMPYAFI